MLVHVFIEEFALVIEIGRKILHTPMQRKTGALGRLFQIGAELPISTKPTPVVQKSHLSDNIRVRVLH